MARILKGLGAAPAGLRKERAQASSQFRGGRFENTNPVRSPMKDGKMLATTGEYFFGSRNVVRRPPHALPLETPFETWSKNASSGLRVTWLGHSTTVLEIDGARVLTDPVWSNRISPVSFMGPKRFHPAPISISELPPLDAILISHDHFDHLDCATITDLAKLDVPFVTSLGVGAHLEAWGANPEKIIELDWWETARVGGVTFTATPARHFSGRGVGTNATLWSSWSMQTDHHRVFFSGDTGLTPEFDEVRKKLGPFDLVMLEVGAFHPAWGDIHLGPDNALKAHAMLGGKILLPVHWGTFDLALHAWDEPVETLVREAARTNVQVITPRLGRAIEPSHTEHVDAWWREKGKHGELASSPHDPIHPEKEATSRVITST